MQLNAQEQKAVESFDIPVNKLDSMLFNKHPFKVGDKVIRTQYFHGGMHTGDAGTIYQVEADGVHVLLTEYGDVGHAVYNLKLLTDTAPSKIVNPKDVIGSKKPAMSVIPAGVLFEVGLAMMEGAAKYGRHNFRATPV
jgi:hypothetical protein